MAEKVISADVVTQVEALTDKNGSDTSLTEMPAILATLSEKDYQKIGKRATLKMDIVIMPILMTIYVLNYLDRNNVAAAKLANITVDLDLSATQYQTCIAILYVGYIMMMVPSNMLISKIKYPGMYICAAMAVWGVISAAQAVVHSYVALAICRFFVGFVEAVFFPGALYYLSMFYTRKQYAFRSALFYAGSQTGNAIGGLFAIGIVGLDEEEEEDGEDEVEDDEEEEEEEEVNVDVAAP